MVRAARIVLLVLAAVLAGCGFQLRGHADLPFESLYVNVASTNPLGAELKRYLRAGTKTKVVDATEEAEATLNITTQLANKTILSLNSSGRVREFRLRYVFGFRVVNRGGLDIIAPQLITVERDFPFNDSDILAKETEEALNYREMQSDVVQQVIRRLAAAQRLKPAP
jgi:LPS-assembly lipoprotein